MADGCWTLAPGDGICVGIGSEQALAWMTPSALTATILIDVVPASRPMTTAAGGGMVGHAWRIDSASSTDAFSCTMATIERVIAAGSSHWNTLRPIATPFAPEAIAS